MCSVQAVSLSFQTRPNHERLDNLMFEDAYHGHGQAFLIEREKNNRATMVS